MWHQLLEPHCGQKSPSSHLLLSTSTGWALITSLAVLWGMPLALNYSELSRDKEVLIPVVLDLLLGLRWA